MKLPPKYEETRGRNYTILTAYRRLYEALQATVIGQSGRFSMSIHIPEHPKRETRLTVRKRDSVVVYVLDMHEPIIRLDRNTCTLSIELQKKEAVRLEVFLKLSEQLMPTPDHEE